MNYLKYLTIQGEPDHVTAVLEHFGEVYLGGSGRIPPDEDLCLTITRVLPNFYRDSNARESGSPLYLVVPNMPIHNV